MRPHDRAIPLPYDLERRRAAIWRRVDAQEAEPRQRPGGRRLVCPIQPQPHFGCHAQRRLAALQLASAAESMCNRVHGLT